MGNGDERERAEAAQLWTPAAKLPENVKKMAWYLFLECWKAELGSSTRSGAGISTIMWDDERTAAIHSDCIAMAQVIHKNENPSSEIPT